MLTALSPNDAAYVFYRACFDAPDGSGKRSRTVFVHVCPSGTPARRKMLSATAAAHGLKACLVGHSAVDCSAGPCTRAAIVDRVRRY